MTVWGCFAIIINVVATTATQTLKTTTTILENDTEIKSFCTRNNDARALKGATTASSVRFLMS